MAEQTATQVVNQFQRWGIEHRPIGGGRWTELGTAGSAAEAYAWLLRFACSGDFRVRRPKAGGTVPISGSPC